LRGDIFTPHIIRHIYLLEYTAITSLTCFHKRACKSLSTSKGVDADSTGMNVCVVCQHGAVQILIVYLSYIWHLCWSSPPEACDDSLF
jgi:hypothetical protein